MALHRYHGDIIAAIKGSDHRIRDLASMAKIHRCNLTRYVARGGYGLSAEALLRLMEVLGLFGQRKPLVPREAPVPGERPPTSHDTPTPPEPPAKALVPMKAPERPALTSGMKKGKIDPRSASKGVAAH